MQLDTPSHSKSETYRDINHQKNVFLGTSIKYSFQTTFAAIFLLLPMLFWRGFPVSESRFGNVGQPKAKPRTLHQGYQESYPPAMRKLLSPFFTARTIAMVTIEVIISLLINVSSS